MEDIEFKGITILVLSGLPASGKTTFAEEFVKRPKNQRKWVRINRDSLRHMSGEYWVPDREQYITNLEDGAIIAAISSHMNIILDATNLDNKMVEDRIHRCRLRTCISPDKIRIEHKFFDVPLNECIRRDAARLNPVGEKVIKGMHRKHFANKPKNAVIEYREQDTSLPSCYVFDIDGTVAMMDGRIPYEWDRVGEDEPNTPVCNIAFELAKTHYIVFLSGRDGSCRTLTEEWLREYVCTNFQLYMREPNDNRKDSIVKKELYENYVFPRYYVAGVFDDRDQVVDMVRKELKLPCFQVNYGDF